ncbi:MAG: 16S rRNA (uracil(1498)-N(3))-methyltransferase [Candidatus Margulisiibacteriota bacterium]
MSRFFIQTSLINGNSINITGSDYNHIKNVLRKKSGDKITCFDSSGTEYDTGISAIEKDKLTLNIIKTSKKDVEPKIRITLAQALPKSSKMDDIVQKSTELGVFEIIPVVTQRCITKADKNERWNKIAKESAEQSGRVHVPAVKAAVSLDEFLSSCSGYDLMLLPWECESSRSLKTELMNNKNASSILILIGPEGGFSAEEAEKANLKGFKSVSLGKRILRTQTAGPATLAMILYEMEMK